MKLNLSITELQTRLGRKLQVTIYNSSLNDGDGLVQAARDCRVSLVQPSGSGWDRNDQIPIFAVRAVAEDLGDIPYPLLCEEVYIEGDDQPPGINEHALAMASLAIAVTNSFSLDQLEKLALTAFERGTLNNEQLSLIKKHFLGEDKS